MVKIYKGGTFVCKYFKYIIIILFVVVVILFGIYFFKPPFNENSFFSVLDLNGDSINTNYSEKAILDKIYNNIRFSVYKGDGYYINFMNDRWSTIYITSNKYKFIGGIYKIALGMEKKDIEKAFNRYKSIKDLPNNEFGYIIDERFWVIFQYSDGKITKIILQNGF